MRERERASFENLDDPEPYSCYNRRQSPRTGKKLEYSGLLNESRREVLDFTSSRKRSEQEKEQELERTKAKANIKDLGGSMESKQTAATTTATVSMSTSHNQDLSGLQQSPDKQQQQQQQQQQHVPNQQQQHLPPHQQLHLQHQQPQAALQSEGIFRPGVVNVRPGVNPTNKIFEF